MATFGFKAAGVEVDQADRTDRPATGAAEAAAEDATAVRKGAFYSWYHRKCSEAVESPFDVLYGTSKPAASYWFAVVLWLKLVINFLHSVGQSTELEWGVWVQLALGVTVCILVLVRPYISLDDERVDIAALLSLVGVLACTFTARAGEPLAPAYTAVAAVLAAAPIVTLFGLNLWAKRTAKKERAHLRCGAMSDGPGPLARPKPAAAHAALHSRTGSFRGCRAQGGSGTGKRGGGESEKDATLAQKLGQHRSCIAVFPQECVGQRAYVGPTNV